MNLWIAGFKKKESEHAWDWLGVFDSEKKAIAVCSNENCFIAPDFLNNKYADTIWLLDGSYYPLKETKQEGAIRIKKEILAGFKKNSCLVNSKC